MNHHAAETRRNELPANRKGGSELTSSKYLHPILIHFYTPPQYPCRSPKGSSNAPAPSSYVSITPSQATLILNPNLHILLPLRNNFFLLLTLQARQFFTSFLDDPQCVVDLGFGDDERGSEADNVLVGWFGLLFVQFVSSRVLYAVTHGRWRELNSNWEGDAYE